MKAYMDHPLLPRRGRDAALTGGWPLAEFYSKQALALAQQGYITVWGDINDALCEGASMALMNMLHPPTWPDVPTPSMATLLICSGGGDESHARGLIGVIELCKAHGMDVRAFGAGIVGSAAFDIFVACTRGLRFVTPLTMLMTHSSSAELRNKREIKLQEELDDFTLSTYTQMTKQQRLRFLETGDWYFSPTEAIAYGAVDAIIRPGEVLPTTPVETHAEPEKAPIPE